MTPEAAVDEIVKDLRDRKILKWLFDENPEEAGELWPGVRAIGADVQDEIFSKWLEIISAAVAAEREACAAVVRSMATRYRTGYDACVAAEAAIRSRGTE